MSNTDVFAEKISAFWISELSGDLSGIKIQALSPSPEVDTDKFPDIYIKLLLANIATALSACDLLGSATDRDLKSVKTRMDVAASNVYSDAMRRLGNTGYIASTEGKDEDGNSVDDPLKNDDQGPDISKYGLAIDVIDGTTMAAKGIGGAYSLSAAALGLRQFPDLQAYTIGAPVEVLESIDFNNDIEKEAINLAARLSEYYNKPVSSLNIVTHSFDTGRHHTGLIRVLGDMGVNVIIPDPVIVEPPYVLGMALRATNGPDAMIGVFGLPEIVINTILMSVVNPGYELRFRIASNTMLKRSGDKTLSEAFSFTSGELDELAKSNLDYNEVFKINAITQNMKHSCFAATALTNDPVLMLNGVKRDGNLCVINTICSSYGGPVYKVTTSHYLRRHLNYSAIYPQEIHDLSVVLPITDVKASEYSQSFINALHKSGLSSSLLITPIVDLHVTLYEMGIHYGAFPGQSQMDEVFAEAENYFRLFAGEPVIKLIGPAIAHNSIIMEVEVAGVITPCDDGLADSFFNTKSAPDVLHITIARFSEYPCKAKYDELSELIMKYPKAEVPGFPEKAVMVYITRTPYDVGRQWEN